MVSDGEDLSTRELVARLAPLLERSVRFLAIPERALRFAARLAGKRSASIASWGRLRLIPAGSGGVGGEWEPPVTLGCGLEATARWYLEMFGPSA